MESNSAPSSKLYRVALSFCGVSALLTIIWPKEIAGLTRTATGFVFETFGWFFLVSVSAFLALCIWLAFSRHGRTRLGDPDSKPEFSTVSWLSMLFAAGMGTGLVVWGTAEPMYHLLKPPSGTPGSLEAASQAFLITNFHWGIHAWAIYGIGALVLGYFSFVRGGAYLPSTPIRLGFKGAWTGGVGTAADLLAIFAVTFGVAGSIAMGTLLVHSGLHSVFGVPMDSLGVDLAILSVLFLSYMASATTGLEKGIRILSNVNMFVAVILIFVLLALGPTWDLTVGFFSNLFEYGASLIPLSITVTPFDASPQWIGDWTLIYFVWWIAWTPFVGIFIARISRGRTIREFVIGVLVCPTVFSIFWFSVLGGIGTHLQLSGARDFTQPLKDDILGLVYPVLESLPMGTLLGSVATVLVFIFLVTSVDSATFVLGMLTSDGDLNPGTDRKLAWGVVLGLLGGAFSLAKDADVIKVLTIAGAVPFLVILLVQLVAFLKALREDEPQQE